MARLGNLGQPFGSPGGIINVPAPSGSALAGQIQMQSMQGLGQALGAYLGQRKQNQLWEQDQPNIQNFLQSYAASQQPGFTGPPPQLPEMRSRRGQGFEQSVLQAQLGGIFGDPFGVQRTKAGLQEAQTEEARTPKPMLPTQETAKAKLDVYNKAKAIPPEKRNKYQQSTVERFELGQPLVSVSVGDKMTTNTLALRREFQTDPRIKDMRTIDKFTANVVTAHQRSLTSTNLGPIDISLAKSFQKLTDLGSSVREGEFATTFAGQKLINKIIGKAQAVVKGGLGFTPEDRKEILDLVLVLQKDSRKMHDEAYNEFSITADEFGFNKRAIFGGTEKYNTETAQPSGLTPEQQMRREELRKKAGM